LYSAIDSKELKVVNSAVREFCQKHYEFRSFKGYLKSNHIDLINKVILDVGCGSGYSSQLIMDEFKPKELFAFDFLPEEIELARQRGLPANLFVGDVTHILLPSDKFDAVFAFDVLHHVGEWHTALKEINRVLKCGGVLLVHEPRKKALDNLERFLKIRHPVESRFEWPELFKGLVESGFHVVERRNMYLGLFQSCLCIKDE
jgi:ubiquinone/menaquinone biosynthesis C-methylase UbiE